MKSQLDAVQKRKSQKEDDELFLKKMKREKAIGKELVTRFLEPVLLGEVNMSFSPRALVIFQHKPQSVKQHTQYSVGIENELAECGKALGRANTLIFASVQEKRPGSRGVKFYRIYETCGCLDTWRRGQQVLCCEKPLLEEEVGWDDAFDTSVAELFEDSLTRMVFRDVLKACRRLAGLGIEVLHDADAMVLTAPWVM